jgi:nucleotide-binding universal stress UspA family protein
MIKKINTILYATDLSKNSAYAFRYAINSAQKHDARIHILHALEPPSVRTFDYVDPFKFDKIRKGAKKEVLNEIKKRLEEFCQRELKDHPEYLERVASVQVVEGYPTEEILQKAAECNADMVITGTHSKGALAHAFLGSVAEAVLNRSKIPVFIIPIPKETDISFGD